MVVNKKASKLTIIVCAVIIIWGNYLISPLGKDQWRSNNLTGYDFQEAPDYFKFLEEKTIVVFTIQEILIVCSTLLLLKAFDGKD